MVCVSPACAVCVQTFTSVISQPARACPSVDLGTWVQRIQRAMHIMGIKGWCAEVDFTLRSTTIPKGWASFECGAQEGYPRSIFLVARLSLHITCSDGRYSGTNPTPDSVRVRQFTTACTTCSSFRMLRSTSGATEQVVPTESSRVPYRSTLWLFPTRSPFSEQSMGSSIVHRGGETLEPCLSRAITCLLAERQQAL